MSSEKSILNEQLRQLPSVDQWIKSPPGHALCQAYSRDTVLEAVRAELIDQRNQVLSESHQLPSFDNEAFERCVRNRVCALHRLPLQKVINATGIILHTNLGRAPLAPAALQAIVTVAAGYTNLELNLNTGKRGSRNDHTETLLRELSGAEAAMVVNNCAAAILLVLSCIAKKRKTIISRGELIEIGGSFRMPDVIAESDSLMIEVGTSNRTTLSDYENAIDSETSILLASHPSNYRIVGFTDKPSLAELSALAHKHDCLSVLDLGSGCLADLTKVGISGEPSVADCVKSGIDLITFSGDKMLGGPQAGIIVGKRALIEKLRSSPLARAMRIDKLSLAALLATLRLYKSPHDPFTDVPVLRMLKETNDHVADRSKALIDQLGSSKGMQSEMVDSIAYMGGGSLPQYDISSKAVRVSIANRSAAAIAEQLRLGTPSIMTRVKDNALLIDLRTVQEDETKQLVNALRSCIR